MNICSVPGCGRPMYCKGLCGTHYQRLKRTGDVDRERRIGQGKGAKFLADHARHQSDECLEWPYSKSSNGYGQTTHQGRRCAAHRKMCELAHGKPPSASHQAAHSCGNRSCVNPMHLRWATPKDNTHDKFAHGTMLYGENSGGAKITNAEAVTAFRDERPAATIAQELGVSKDAILKLKRGETFARVTSGNEHYEQALGGN